MSLEFWSPELPLYGICTFFFIVSHLDHLNLGKVFFSYFYFLPQTSSDSDDEVPLVNLQLLQRQMNLKRSHVADDLYLTTDDSSEGELFDDSGRDPHYKLPQPKTAYPPDFSSENDVTTSCIQSITTVVTTTTSVSASGRSKLRNSKTEFRQEKTEKKRKKVNKKYYV